MAHALYTNNATATLAGGISSSATTIVLNSGQGSLFPSPTGGNYFYGTLTDAATGTLIEIVKVTSRTTDSMVVARGQQGTAAQAYNANDKFELRVTAGGLSELAALDGFTVTGPIVLSGNAVNSLEAVPKQQLDAAIAGVSIPDASTTVKGKVQLATTSEALALTDALKVLTPAALAYALSIRVGHTFATNDWAPLPGGLIIQWGTTATVPINGTLAVTFPMTFPTAAAICLAGGTANTVNASSAQQTAMNVYALSTTGFSISNDDNAMTARWFAIGY